MSSILLREFICDHMYGGTIGCTETLVVKTGSLAYGTNDSKLQKLDGNTATLVRFIVLSIVP